jgi:putative membrane protein
MKERQWLYLIYALSAVIFIAVVVLFNLPKSGFVPEWAKGLPRLNAILNGTTFLLLLISWFFIKRKNRTMHKRLNITAFLLSSLFLISYVTFHSFGVETSYPKEEPLRPLYLFILISHIILAGVVLPLVLLSFYRALNGQIDKHKKIVKYSFPIWLYVTASGVIVYLMISPHYKF